MHEFPEQEIGLRPEHIPQMFEEAKSFIERKDLDLAHKIDGIKIRISGFENVISGFEAQKDTLLDEIDEATASRNARTSEENEVKVLENDIREFSKKMEAAKSLISAMQISREAIQMLEMAQVPLTNPELLKLSRWSLDLGESITERYRSMARDAHLLHVAEIEEMRNNLRSNLASTDFHAPEIVAEFSPNLKVNTQETLEWYQKLWESKGGGVKYDPGQGLKIDEELKRPN